MHSFKIISVLSKFINHTFVHLIEIIKLHSLVIIKKLINILHKLSKFIQVKLNTFDNGI